MLQTSYRWDTLTTAQSMRHLYETEPYTMTVIDLDRLTTYGSNIIFSPRVWTTLWFIKRYPRFDLTAIL